MRSGRGAALKDPIAFADRLALKEHLDTTKERLRVSK
jgi:hypothetical protein